MESHLWFFYAVVTMLFWGVWGALIERPEKNGFPATLGYAVWALTMVPCAVVALAVIGWVPEHDLRSVVLGSAAGLLGAAGQLVLFDTLRRGPAYLVFPVISLSPVVSVLLSVLLLGETASPRAWAGIVLALLAMPLLSYQPPNHSSPARGRLWFVLAFLVLPGLGHPGLRAALRERHHAQREHLLLHDGHGAAARAGGGVDDGLHEAHQLGAERPLALRPRSSSSTRSARSPWSTPSVTARSSS